MEGSTGWASVTMPNCRAKAACCSAVRDWSRKKMTWWALRASRIAATTSGASGSAMSTPEISAPMVGESGWTLTEVARVTGRFCPRSRRPSIAEPGRPRFRTLPPTLARHRIARRKGAEHERGHRGPRAHPAGPQLLVLVPVDDPAGRHDPRGPASRGRPRPVPGLAGAPPGPPGRAARTRARRGPAQPRDARVGGLRRLPAGQDRLRHRGHHVGSRLPAGPRRPAGPAARAGRPGLPRARARQDTGRRAGAHRHAQR